MTIARVPSNRLLSRGHAPDELDADPLLARRWLLEAWLARIRWSGVPLGLLLPVLFPPLSWPLTVTLAVGLILGNGALSWLLAQPVTAARLRIVRGCAAALEWAAGLWVIALRGWDVTSKEVGVLLVLVVLGGVRYGLRGVIGAAVGSGVAVGVLAGVQWGVLGTLSARGMAKTLAEWEPLILLMALTVGALIRAGSEWFDWELARWERAQRAYEDWQRQESARWVDQELALRRYQSGLSARQWEVLELLACPELGYKEIAAELHVEVASVHEYVKRIAAKWGVTGGRVNVVAAARQRGLLADPSQPAPGSSTTTPPSADNA